MSNFVFLHGVPGSASGWRRVIAQLEGHRTLAPDLRGFGGQPPAAHDDELLAPAQARHVLAAMDHAGFDRVVLVGHDFGGPVAAHLIALAPERVEALAVLATNAFPDTPIPFPLSTLNWPVVGGTASRLLFSRASLAMMLRTGVGRPKVEIDSSAYIGDKVQHASISAIFGNSLRRLRELYSPVEEALRRVTVPVLVAWGDRDPFFPVSVGERTAALFANARFRLYEGAGHFLPEERPDDVVGDLLELAALVSRR